MEEEQDEIVVFCAFDSLIDANISKTKLDAHGIPCFLTNENMAGLYPGRNWFSVQVRLHIFKKDLDNVSQLLMVRD